MKITIVTALIMSGNPDAIPLLRGLLNDDDERIRESVTWGLRLLGDYN